MPRFMDFHADLKLPPEAIAQIADDTREHHTAIGVDCGAVHRVDGIA